MSVSSSFRLIFRMYIFWISTMLPQVYDIYFNPWEEMWVDTISFHSFPCTCYDHRHVVAYGQFHWRHYSFVTVSKGVFDTAILKPLPYSSLCQTGWNFSTHYFLLSCRLYLSRTFLVNEIPANVIWDLSVVETVFRAAFYIFFFASCIPLSPCNWNLTLQHYQRVSITEDKIWTSVCGYTWRIWGFSHLHLVCCFKKLGRNSDFHLLP